MSQSDLRRLVLDLKVPWILCSLCSRVAEKDPRSLAAAVAFKVLDLFLWPVAGCVKSSQESAGIGCSGSCGSRCIQCRNSHVLTALCSQVERSGVLDSLTKVMTAAAQDITGQPDADHPAAVFFDLSRTYLGTLSTHYPVLWHCRTLLSTWGNLGLLGTLSNTSRQASGTYPAIPGVVRLSASMLHVITRELPAVAAAAEPAVVPVPEESSAAQMLYGAVDAVTSIFRKVGFSLASSSHDERYMQTFAGVLPQLSRVLATIVTLEAESMLLQHQLAQAKAVKGASGSVAPSGSSSRSNTACGVAGSAASPTFKKGSKASDVCTDDADGFAVIRKVRRTCRTLPDCIRNMLQAQGIDSRGVLWAAAALRHNNQYQTLWAAADVYKQLALWVESRPRDAQQHVQRQQLQQQMLLVAAELLRCAAGGSKAASNPLHAEQCGELACTAHDIIHLGLSLSETPFDPTADSTLALGAQPAQWLQQVVSDSQQILGALLQVCRHPATAITTSNTPPRGLTASAVPARSMIWVREGIKMLTHLLVKLLQAAAGSCDTLGRTPSAAPQPMLICAAAPAQVHHSTNAEPSSASMSAATTSVNAARAAARAVAPLGLDSEVTSLDGIQQWQNQGLETPSRLSPGMTPRRCLQAKRVRGSCRSGTSTAEQNSTTAQLHAAADSTTSVPCQYTAGELQLPMGLAALKGVTMQIISCFESFIRAAAAGLVDGSLVHCGPILEDPDQPGQCRVCLMICSVAAVFARARVTDRNKIGWTPGPLLALVHAAGPGSFEQRQMYSLLRSMVKLSNALCGHAHAGRARKACSAAAAAAALLLVPVSDTLAGLVVAPSSTSSPAAAAAAAAAGHFKPKQSGFVSAEHTTNELVGGPPAAPAGATGESTKQLLAVAPLLARQSSAGPQLPAVLQVPSLMLLGLFWNCMVKLEITSTAAQPLILPCIWLAPVLDWLRAPVHASQLQAAEYIAYGVLPLLQGLHDTMFSVRHKDALPGIEPGQLMEQLYTAGAALTFLPTHVMCKNPGCSNVTGHSELQLVTGSSCQCGGCRTAHYCSRTCQREDWRRHKPVCRALAAALAESQAGETAAEGLAAAAAGTAGLHSG